MVNMAKTDKETTALKKQIKLRKLLEKKKEVTIAELINILSKYFTDDEKKNIKIYFGPDDEELEDD